MRIGLLTGELPDEKPAGGIGVYTEQLSRRLAELGHDVQVFVVSNWEEESHVWPNSSFVVHRVAESKMPTSLKEKLCEVHLAKPFDIFEAPDIWHLGLNLESVREQVPLVVRLHTPVHVVNEYHREQSTLRGFVRKALLPIRGAKSPLHPRFGQSQSEYLQASTADGITAPSRAIANRIANDWSIDIERIQIIPNGVSLVSKDSQLATRNSNEVLFAARLDKLKGILDFVAAMKIVFDTHPSATVRLAGKDGTINNRSALAIIEAEWAPWKSRWRWDGELPHDKCLEAMSSCGVAVFPSHWESFGIACAEAMSLGTPVICSNSGGLDELVDNGINGLKIAAKHPESLAKAILYFLAEPEKAMQLGGQARQKIAQQFSIVSTVERTLSYYREVIDNHTTHAK